MFYTDPRYHSSLLIHKNKILLKPCKSNHNFYEQKYALKIHEILIFQNPKYPSSPYQIQRPNYLYSLEERNNFSSNSRYFTLRPRILDGWYSPIATPFQEKPELMRALFSRSLRVASFWRFWLFSRCTNARARTRTRSRDPGRLIQDRVAAVRKFALSKEEADSPRAHSSCYFRRA